MTLMMKKYILVLSDYFANLCETTPLSQLNALALACVIMNHWILRCAVSCQLHSVRGIYFKVI